LPDETQIHGALVTRMGLCGWMVAEPVLAWGFGATGVQSASLRISFWSAPTWIGKAPQPIASIVTSLVSPQPVNCAVAEAMLRLWGRGNLPPVRCSL